MSDAGDRETDADEIAAIREQKRREMLEGARSGEAASEPEDDDVETAGPREPIHVRGEDHFRDVTATHDVVLVDYHADWCGPCQMLEPLVAEIARETSAAVAKIDVDAHQGLARDAGVRGVPTLFLYVDGEPVERLVGLQDGATLRELVEQYV